MNTETAKEIAEKRTAFLEVFLQELELELKAQGRDRGLKQALVPPGNLADMFKTQHNQLK